MQATPEEKRGNSYVRKRVYLNVSQNVAKQKQNAGRYVQVCHMQGFVPVLRPMNVTRLGVQPRNEGWLAMVPGVGGRQGCGQGLYLG